MKTVQNYFILAWFKMQLFLLKCVSQFSKRLNKFLINVTCISNWHISKVPHQTTPDNINRCKQTVLTRRVNHSVKKKERIFPIRKITIALMVWWFLYKSYVCLLDNISYTQNKQSKSHTRSSMYKSSNRHSSWITYLGSYGLVFCWCKLQRD